MAEGDDKTEGVRDEFLAEAQEIVETLSRDLLVLDQAQKEGNPDPDLVNEVFRGVHTLKGIAGMFGYHQVGAVAHALEDLLEDLRLGRVSLTQEVLDVLFEGVENFQRLLGGARGGESYEVDLNSYARQIERVSSPEEPQEDVLDGFGIDPNVLAVLTEYEEHRLRTNVAQGVPLYRLRVRFSLASIDSALEELKAAAKPVAEIITYLPSMGDSDGDSIDLDVLLASEASRERLEELLAVGDAELLLVNEPKSATIPPLPAPVKRHTEAPKRVPQEPPSLDVAPATTDDEPDGISLRSVSNSVRVDIRKLDYLMNVVGELAIVRSAVARVTERVRGRPEQRQLALDLHRINRSFERRLEELQDGI
ncbi:MAG: Hpt domain-containing protein, partial [Myxococcota bacterium]